MSAKGLRGLAGTLKFWLVEFWGPKWDWHRRALLWRHFRAYFSHPPVPAEHIPATIDADATARERGYSAAYMARIAAVQTSARHTVGVHLTYRPIGKNLRLLGTAVRDGADGGQRVMIRPGGPPDELRMLGARGQAWSPWLWSRTSAGDGGAPPDAARAWNTLFSNPPARPTPSDAAAIPPLPQLDAGNGPFEREHLATVLKMAAATRYIFSPRRETMERIGELKRAAGWPSGGEPVLGIHVRRGDAAAAAATDTPSKSTRKSFPLETYLQTADTFAQQYGIRHIFLATESREEIERASALRPQYRFLWLDYDRSLFPDIRTSNQFIEDLALAHPERARALAVTAILDLYCFCECAAFIGAFNSEFSVLGWLLAIGSRGHLVPYVSLSHPAEGRSLDPRRALLNLENNCPLELYHW